MHDVGSNTGRNLRRIMLQTNKDTVDELATSDVKDIKYFPTDEYWRPILLKEFIQLTDGSLVVDGFTTDELKLIIDDICVN